MCKRLIVIAIAGLVLGITSTTFGDEDPTLVGWWKLNEGDGNVALDSSAKGVNGTINNLGGGLGPNGSVWLEDPERGMVLSFNGNDTSGAYVVAGGIPAMDLTNDFTWMVWCKQDQAGTGVNETMLGNRYGGTASPLQFVKFTPTKFEYYNDDTNYANSITFPTVIPDGEWVHNVAVKKGATLTYYRNGKKVLSVTLTKTMDANPFYIGGDPVDERWRGCLSDVRLYERAVTEEEIFQIGAQLKARKPSPANGTLNVNAGVPLLQWTAGDSAMFHTVYLGLSPDLTEDDVKASRQATLFYYHFLGFTAGATYYWRVDETEKDMVTVHTGDVWTFTVQDVTTYHPSPADGENTIFLTPTLTWLPGAGAIKHHVYFSDSVDAVHERAAAADQGTLDLADALFAPETLDALTTYYWRVDGVLLGNAVQEGPVWSFTTALPIDDFESYNDVDNLIFDTWLDGYTNGTGSTVGNWEAPFAELFIVHDANQAMPIDYNNIDAPFYSEAQRQFESAQDWTIRDANTLVLAVRGRLINSPEPLYVTIEDASKNKATVGHPDPAILTTTKWSEWKIPLSEFAGVNLSRVKTIYIGVGDKADPQAGGTGRVYIDDIGLTRPGADQ